MQHEMRGANEHFQWNANTTERQRQVKRKAAWDIFQRQIKKQKVRVDIEDLQPLRPPVGLQRRYHKTQKTKTTRTQTVGARETNTMTKGEPGGGTSVAGKT